MLTSAQRKGQTSCCTSFLFLTSCTTNDPEKIRRRLSDSTRVCGVLHMKSQYLIHPSTVTHWITLNNTRNDKVYQTLLFVTCVWEADEEDEKEKTGKRNWKYKNVKWFFETDPGDFKLQVTQNYYAVVYLMLVSVDRFLYSSIWNRKVIKTIAAPNCKQRGVKSRDSCVSSLWAWPLPLITSSMADTLSHGPTGRTLTVGHTHTHCGS